MIAIIPARAGSKRIKNKNIKKFNNKPIIYWSIKAAINSKIFDEVIVSTDSMKIKNIAEKYGAKVPFKRPKKLSGDFTSTRDVIKHAINFLRKQNLLPYQNIENLISFQKNEKYPIGYMMLNRNNAVVGFVGTWFSERKIKGYENIFCNIHSWIVQQEYRLYSFYLISLLNKKNINLTAFTPVESLKGLLLKFGFEKSISLYNIVWQSIL